jgi:hypothetical protein
MKQLNFHKIFVRVLDVILVLLAMLFVGKMMGSFNWRMEHDTPLLHYVAFMMDQHGAVPYRDIFETSMPLSFAFHYLIVTLFGYSDLAFRFVDVFFLLTLLTASYFFLMRFGKKVALVSCLLFGLVYYFHGQIMSLQRDYIGLLPIVFSLLSIPSDQQNNIEKKRFVLVGFLFGISFLIKPHLIIAMPLIIAALFATGDVHPIKHFKESKRYIFISGISFSIPIVVTLLWLYAHDALQPFLNLFINYLPLHSSLTGYHSAISGSERIIYLVNGTLNLGGYGLFFLLSLFAFYRIFTIEHLQKNKFISLMVLFLSTLLYAIYPTIAGKFWDYHYMPFAYFCSITAGLCFYNWPYLPDKTLQQYIGTWIVPFLFCAAVFISGLPFVSLVTLKRDIKFDHAATGTRDGRADEIAQWLSSRLKPEDKVQPLDWTGGSIHAMLLAKAPLATRFMYDYHFYHNVSNPFIKELRKTFMHELTAAVPKFIIQVDDTNKPWVTGIDTNKEFPELTVFLNTRYKVAFIGKGYKIFERN